MIGLLGILRKNKKANSGLLGLSLSSDGLAFAHIAPHSASRHGLRLKTCRPLPATGLKAQAGALKDLVKELDLEKLPCNFVLDPGDYNLLLVEAPKVEPDEMASAIRWRIKDLVDRPIEDCAIDLFPVPREAYRSQGGMVYVVVARRSRIPEVRDLVEGAGLQLQSIDIPELALRNLSGFYTDDSNGLAFIDLRPQGSTLNLSRNGAIYLTRHLNTAVEQGIIDTPDWESVKERLTLEIQRSLDYFESQMGQGQIPRLLLAPRGGDGEALAAELDGAMPVRVESMNLSGKLEADEPLPVETQYACLSALGGALRQYAENGAAEVRGEAA